MANELISNQELALWTQTPEGTITGDQYAQFVRTTVSDLVRARAEQPTWTAADVPITAKMIALAVMRRCYVNPDQEVASTTGPISSRLLDVAALAAEFSEQELKDLDLMKPNGGAGGGLWALAISRGDLEATTAFIPDDSGSDWWIPYGDFRTTDAFNEDEDTLIP